MALGYGVWGSRNACQKDAFGTAHGALGAECLQSSGRELYSGAKDLEWSG